MKVVPQLDKAAEESPVKGYLQDGTQTQEGFVSQGLKFVNRMGFARQNLAARQQQLTEDQVHIGNPNHTHETLQLFVLSAH